MRLGLNALSLVRRVRAGLSSVVAALFAASEQGAWYEPDVPTALVTRRNLLTKSEQTTVSPWLFTSASGTATQSGNNYTFGANSFDRISQGGISVVPGQVVTSTVRLSGSGTVRLLTFNGDGGSSGASMEFVLTSTPTDYFFTRTITIAGSNAGLGVYNNNNGTAGASFTLHYAQLEYGSTATNYQKVTDWNTEYLAAAGNAVTLFQFADGTVPVTAVEQPVGLMLDKRLGLVRGAELVSNGGFDSPTGWSIISANLSISGGTLNSTVNGSKTAWNNTSAVVAGRSYIATWNQVHSGSNGVRINCGNPSDNFASGYINGTGPKIVIFVATMSGNVGVFAYNDGMTIDDFSVRELPGNHATQATTAQKPVLSARKNLLTYSEQFDNAAWVKVGAAISANTTVDPNGGTSADTLTATAGTSTVAITQTAAVVVTSYVQTVYAKAGTYSYLWVGDRGDAAGIRSATFDLTNGTVLGASSGTAAITALQNGWYRCELRYSRATAGSASGMYAFGDSAHTLDRPSKTWAGAETLLLFGAEIELGSTATTYQRVNTATDYDTVGFKHYLKFDGTDDSLATAAIDFSATDKMSVFAGVRKLSDAATGHMVELSASSGGSNGVFHFAAPNTGANYTFRSKGTIVADAAYTNAAVAAPVTTVLVGTADIAGDLAALRTNGIQTALIVTDQGTGNFGNYPLYIGRRGGTTLPFNGHLYSLVVRGAASDAAQITATETYINTKTGAY